MGFPAIEVPRLHRDLWRHEAHLPVFVLCRSLFDNLTGPGRIKCQQKRQRAHRFQSFTKDYLHPNGHGTVINRVQDVADSLWEKGQFLPNSPLDDIFRAYTDQKTKTESFRASIGLPPLARLLDKYALHLPDEYSPSSRSRKSRLREKLLHAGVSKSQHVPRHVSKPDDDRLPIMESGASKYYKSQASLLLHICIVFPSINPSRSCISLPSLASNIASSEVIVEKPRLGAYEKDYDCTLHFPIRSQHPILVTIPQLLEEALFSLAARCFPEHLERNNWTQLEAVEYTLWGSILTQFRHEISGKLESGNTFDCISYFYRRLTDVRHLAVHRRAGVPIELVVSQAFLSAASNCGIAQHRMANILCSRLGESAGRSSKSYFTGGVGVAAGSTLIW
ncbi:putative ubiquinol-cytochrome-c reductase cytochrome c1 protein [Botrytis fragariae]|uniref:Putative ubiquinol-cytochrome-c reductase cytochrome c1 protein n=1 Tax=Botrytis fragariae TaxID=1964551 RepID=A0A8H6EDF2_9HELO|nr:putative ubiquinol-cytochrome-c reductase cytochrome c1 protein [Botrytis fragariae]KAF5868053.1 putative ubiquinol-cytochrome-c reductase cytochrome c1 protein [Botrytis fragariae]